MIAGFLHSSSRLIDRTTLEVIGKTGFGHDFKALEDAHGQSENLKNYEALMKELRNFILFFPAIAKITGQNKKVSLS